MKTDMQFECLIYFVPFKYVYSNAKIEREHTSTSNYNNANEIIFITNFRIF